MLARAYALGLSRGARETAAHAHFIEADRVVAVEPDASEHVRRFAEELRCELCGPVG